jgi:Protein of unknown function DUF2617
MGVSSGRSRVADLAFQVFNRTLHPEWFTTRTFLRVTRKDWEVDVRIIDGGHVVLFRSGPVRLAETLSGLDTVLPGHPPLFQSHLRRERSALVRPGGTIEYQSCFEVERVDIEIFRHLTEEVSLQPTSNRLFHRFGATNRLAPQPISQIQVDARANDMSIQSFHTFPEECAIVRTQSLLELKPRHPQR